jgi:hypothetical protein
MLALRHNEIDRAHRAFDFVVGNAAAGCSSIWVSDRNGGDELLRVGVLRIFEDSRTRPISTADALDHRHVVRDEQVGRPVMSG